MQTKTASGVYPVHARLLAGQSLGEGKFRSGETCLREGAQTKPSVGLEGSEI